jgi:hypothetical protein
MSSSKECPVYLKEREIQKIKIEKKSVTTAFHDQTFGIENSELDLLCIGQPSFCMGLH